MVRRRLYVLLLLCLFVSAGLPQPARAAAQSVEQSIQAFLDAQPGPLKSYREQDHTAAEQMEGVSAYYGVSPRIMLALLEGTSGLLSTPAVPDATLRQPFGAAGPDGFGAQLDWAARELRAGMGPYQRPPVVTFTDGTTQTLSLQQAPEGVAVQRFLAKGRSAAEWQTTYNGFLAAFRLYFNNELPDQRAPEPAAVDGFLRLPWLGGTRVTHLAYFDHMYPTVDTNRPDNGFVVNYLGRGGMQYDGHDGHDFYFPDQPIGTSIRAAADGIAYARTHRGNGVVILHPGGYETIYWHLDAFSTIFKNRIDTDQGVRVQAGDFLGTSGKTGFVTGTPHLHFEVRHNGREVDPYGWYGAGSDPCAAYSACEASRWLWHAELIGSYDFTPPNVAPPDATPPVASVIANPRTDLRLLAHFDGTVQQQFGNGAAASAGTPTFADMRYGSGVLLRGDAQIAFPTAGNLDPGAGTIAFWALLPERYPATTTGRNYLLAASATPNEGPVYTGTLALRREQAANGTARWNFWTTPDSGDAGRNDLAAPDALTAGMHHFAISWDQAARTKALYIDGTLAASANDVTLPSDVGTALQLGCFAPGAGQSGTGFDELAIFDHALPASAIADLAAATTPLELGQNTVRSNEVPLHLNATDDAGGIMSVQLGMDGVFNDPQPYSDSFRVTLPASSGPHTVTARVFDRAGNHADASAIVTRDTSSTVFLPMLAAP